MRWDENRQRTISEPEKPDNPRRFGMSRYVPGRPPPNLETGALPVELHSYKIKARLPTASLFDDFGDDPGADGATALADRKAQPLIHRYRCDQLDLHRDVVARHHHLGPLRQMHRPGHVGCAKVK